MNTLLLSHRRAALRRLAALALLPGAVRAAPGG